jgi:hypothetical protein
MMRKQNARLHLMDSLVRQHLDSDALYCPDATSRIGFDALRPRAQNPEAPKPQTQYEISNK